MQGEVAQELRNIFHAPDLATAQTWLNEMVKKYQSKYTKLADWLELNVPEGLTIFLFLPVITGASEPSTCLNVSARKSAAGPGLSGSSPMRLPVCVWLVQS